MTTTFRERLFAFWLITAAFAIYHHESVSESLVRFLFVTPWWLTIELAKKEWSRRHAK